MMISNSGTSTLGLYDLKRQIDTFGGVDYFRPNLAGGYLLNARVMLANGDIVKSTVDVNANDPNVDMTGWVNIEKEQDIINSLIASEGVNILSVYGGVNDFGVAIELAFAKAMATGCRKIIIPDTTYVSKTTANISLSSYFCLEFGSAAVVNVINEIDVFNITQEHHYLLVEGHGVKFHPLWDSNISFNSSVFKIVSNNTAKSLTISNVQAYFKNSNDVMFENIVKAKGLHLSDFNQCTFQARNPIYNESHETGSGYSMGCNINSCYIYTPDDGIGLKLNNKGEYGCEGWQIKGGEWLCGTSIQVVDNLSRNYTPPLLMVVGTHMNSIRFCDIENMSRVVFSACDLQSRLVVNNPYSGLFEINGVHGFNVSGGTTICQAQYSVGSSDADAISVLSIKQNRRSNSSAFVYLHANMWINTTKYLVDIEENADLYGKVFVELSTDGAFVGNLAKVSDVNKIKLIGAAKPTNYTTSISVSTDVSYDSNSGVLTLGSDASASNVFSVSSSIVPAFSTINKIFSNTIVGEICQIVFDSPVSLNHNVDLLMPTGFNTDLAYGGNVDVLIFANGQAKVLNFTSSSVYIPITSKPVSTSSYGIIGQKYFEGGFVYEYIAQTGWVKYAASTF